MARRQDVQDAGGQIVYLPGNRGCLMAIPALPGSYSLTTGIPINGIQGFAPGCLFHNILGTVQGTYLYLNVGTFTSSQWVAIDNSGNLVDLTATTALTQLTNGNKNNLLDASGGFTSTLPAATGSGTRYKFTVKTVSATGYVVATDGTAVYKGWLQIGTVAEPTVMGIFSTTTLKNITLNGTTQGGLSIGDWFEVQDIATNVWTVSGFLTGSGTPATPFS